MKLVDALRRFLKIRTQREIAPAGAMPQIGSSIVLDHLKIKLKHPLNIEQWHWFSKLGWRAVDMRSERRHYTCVPDIVLMKLLEANKECRDALYQTLVINQDEASIKSLHTPCEDDF